MLWLDYKLFKSALARYVLAVAIVAFSAAIRELLQPFLGEYTPYTTFYPAVLISALIGGLGPGILALVLSCVASIWTMPFGVEVIPFSRILIGMSLFIVVNMIIIAVCMLLRNYRSALEIRNLELDAERMRWRAALENIADGVWICDLQGRMSTMNLPAVTHMGLTEFNLKSVEDVLEELEILYPDGTPRPAQDAPLLRSLRGETVHGEEIMIHRRLGKRRNRQFSSAPIRDTAGKIVGAVAIVRDITDLRKAEDDLRQSKEQFQRAIYAAPFPIMIHAEDGTVVAVNNAWTEAAGMKQEQIATISDWTQAAYGERKDVVKADIDRLYNLNQKIDEGEYQIRTVDGRHLIWAFSSAPLGRDSQGRRLIISMAADVTERKHTEEALRESERNLKQNQEYLLRLTNELKTKNEELETIINIASHDLRSPIVNIMGFSGELARSTDYLKQKLKASNIAEYQNSDIMTVLESEIPEDIKYIASSTNSIDQMLRSLLKVAHIVMADIHSGQVDMNALLGAIVDDFKNALTAEAIELKIEQLPDCYADRTLIREVFNHLIGNAIKYLDPQRPGKIAIRGSIKNQYSIYCVEDNGRGIAEEHQKHIFKLFHQLTPDAKSEGIGLTIVRRLVNRMDGNVWLESMPGKGSKFYVALPKI